ncbi:MAG: sulfotransferase, partial [Verrucomicrobiota bacterium]
VIDGRLRNAFSDAYNPRLISHRRLIKATSANLFLRWLYEKFPGMPIVMVIRHPCAVAASRMTRKWNVGMRGWLLEQPDLIEDHLDPYMDEILKAETDFQKQILVWCIQYHVVFRQFKSDEIHISFYEDYCLDPRRHVPELFNDLNLDCPEALFESIDVPSSSSADLDLEADHPVSRWKKQLSTDDIDEALRLLQLFGLDHLYSDSPRPRPDALT